MKRTSYILLIVYYLTRGESELFRPGSSLTAKAIAEAVK